MADSKKYNGSTWLHSLRKLGTATDTITTLPADLYADGTNATVGLGGNMVQNGTPTPTTPIQPSECGERTANLFDKDNDTKPWFINISSYAIQSSTSGSYSIVIKCKPNMTLCCQIPEYAPGQRPRIVEFDHYPSVEDVGSNYQEYDSPNLIYSTSNTAKYVVMFIYNGGAPPSISPDDFFSGTMVNYGSQPLPYEPYGYKLTISSANTTTPVYLGEVETTRRIRKLVLTGEENWTFDSEYSRFWINESGFTSFGVRLTPFCCSHYVSIDDGRAISNVPNNSIYSGSRGYPESHKIFIKDTAYSTAADFKSYLAAQYSAGTPVCVWYVLATETTGILNEPLRKIGTYADTVSGITIPTITGKDTFDVLTTLKPSEVELTYTGWHDASVGEWDGSEWQ